MKTPTLRRVPPGAAGFTLIEVLAAALVVGIAILSGSWAMSGAARNRTLLAGPELTASLLAREVHELALTLPREPSGTVGATTPAQLLALDSLEGASLSPPVRADGTADGSLSGWTQVVDLSVYDVLDPTTPTADDPTLGLPSDGSLIYRLDVTVLKDGSVVDSFAWWLAP